MIEEVIDVADVVSSVVSTMILVVGVSYLLQADQWVRLVREGIETPHRFIPLALFLLVLGLTVIATHNVWVPAWRVVITIFGWLLAIKGAAFLIFPGIAKKFSGWPDQLLRTYVKIAGVVLAAIGAVCSYTSWPDTIR